MTPAPITTKQFVHWLVLWSLGLGIWMAAPKEFMSLTSIFCVFANYSLTTPVERSRPITWRVLLAVVAATLICVGTIYALNHWLPASDAWGRAALRFLRHPAVVLPFWAWSVRKTYRDWKSPPAPSQPAVALPS